MLMHNSQAYVVLHNKVFLNSDYDNLEKALKVLNAYFQSERTTTSDERLPKLKQFFQIRFLYLCFVCTLLADLKWLGP